MKSLYDLRFALVVLVAQLLLALTISHAQSGYSLHDSAFGHFNKDDLKLLQQTITKLNESGTVNETQNWENPASGAKGSVTLLERLTKDGMPCAKLGLVNEAAKLTGKSEFVWCRIESGEWKIAP